MGQDGTAGAGPEDRPPVDETIIDQLASITDAQGFSVLSDLLNVFLGAVPERLQGLDRAVAAGDLRAMADQAHSLTGIAASFGARGMADLCRELRTAADGGDVDAARRLILDLRSEFLRVRAWLTRFRSQG